MVSTDAGLLFIPNDPFRLFRPHISTQEHFMPKMKTVKSASKRFKVTGTGKLVHEKANRSHILTKKAPKRLRQLRQAIVVSGNDEARIKRMLGI
jgi:large subunit ribosomal protein L35